MLLGIDGAVALFTVSRRLSHPAYTEPGAYFTVSVVHFLAALLLLNAAPAIARVFYPSTAHGSSDTSSETAERDDPADLR